jgi:hypothetical protein
MVKRVARADQRTSGCAPASRVVVFGGRRGKWGNRGENPETSAWRNSGLTKNRTFVQK